MSHNQKKSPADQLAQVIQQAVNSWKAQSQAVTTFFSKYEDAAYQGQVAPGRNRAVYLLGHLASASDDIFPLFGAGQRLYPELHQLFSANPDRTFTEMPSIGDLKDHWERINTQLSEYFNTLTQDDWLDRHTRVSEADFAADPLRNRLNVLLSRTNHISYHMGQLNLLHA
jgi:DinB superfamily